MGITKRIANVLACTGLALTLLALPANFAQAHPLQTVSDRGRVPFRNRQAADRLLNVFPEQQSIAVRDPQALISIPRPAVEIPFTIRTKDDQRAEQMISLDEAIQVALQNADVIRVLTGVSASRSGSTIYDVAIANTGVDLQTAVFDPNLSIESTMNKSDRPSAIFDPGDPGRSLLVGSSSDSINTTLSLTKQMFNGGTAGFNASAIGSYFEPGVFPLEPEYRSSAEITLRQPMMRGYGRAANLAPVVIARINTERSYFQFKDSVQELVRGVISAYWNLVSARVDLWAREQQIEQARFAYRRAVARKQKGLDRVADVAQAQSALANFKAGLITSRANLLLTETALRNILGLDPSNTEFLVPTSTPIRERMDFDWEALVAMAQTYRPDIIELKLILEADQQALLQANNQARPQFDGIANYRWDGLSGRMPGGDFLRNDGGRFAGFNLGVNFSVPLGLRQSRASLRRQELTIAQDRVNLEQGLYQATHQLTINVRNLDQFFEQYEAFQEVREAARLNYENQIGEVLADRREFLNVLQAITDWGNAVSQEASSITQYNTELANIERQSGTILEAHGIRFIEERYGSVGPKGLMGIRRTATCYPATTQPTGGTDRYVEEGENSDSAFELEALDYKRQTSPNSRTLEMLKPDQSPRNRPQPNPTINGPETSSRQSQTGQTIGKTIPLDNNDTENTQSPNESTELRTTFEDSRPKAAPGFLDVVRNKLNRGRPARNTRESRPPTQKSSSAVRTAQKRNRVKELFRFR